jgi:hypothetical protein
LSSAIGLSLLEKGWKVLFARTTDLVQRLQVARRELALESAINRLDRFDLIILELCAVLRYVESAQSGDSGSRKPGRGLHISIRAASTSR